MGTQRLEIWPRGEQRPAKMGGKRRTFNRLALDHVGDSLATQVEQILELKIVGSLYGNRNETKYVREERRKFGDSHTIFLASAPREHQQHTMIRSKRVDCSSSAIKSLSQGRMSSVRRSSFLSSLGGGLGFSTLYSAYNLTNNMICSVTLGTGTASPEPRSATQGQDKEKVRVQNTNLHTSHPLAFTSPLETTYPRSSC